MGGLVLGVTSSLRNGLITLGEGLGTIGELFGGFTMACVGLTAALEKYWPIDVRWRVVHIRVWQTE
jgi:hypothetical protein